MSDSPPLGTKFIAEANGLKEKACVGHGRAVCQSQDWRWRPSTEGRKGDNLKISVDLYFWPDFDKLV